MGRLSKLNTDIRLLTDKILENQDLCKLIYYPNKYPLSQPDINGYETILDKRLLPFTPKIPLRGKDEDTQDDGTYVSIRPIRFRPSRGNQYIVSILVFDIYCEKDIRAVYYEEDEREVKGDRALLIMDKIIDIMDETQIGIGKDTMNIVEEIYNRNATFSGYRLGYTDVDFKKLLK